MLGLIFTFRVRKWSNCGEKNDWKDLGNCANDEMRKILIIDYQLIGVYVRQSPNNRYAQTKCLKNI